MTSNLPAIRKDNVISKVINFIKIKLFMKKSKYKEKTIKVNLSGEITREDYLLEIQRKFEAGEIKEEDINKEDTCDLKKLYEEQIMFLNGEIKLVEAEMLK